MPAARVLHRFDVVLNAGSPSRVPQNALESLKKMAGVEAVLPDEPRHLDTDRSPKFIDAPKLWQALGGGGQAGKTSSSASSTQAFGRSIRPSPIPIRTGSRTYSARTKLPILGQHAPGSCVACNGKLIGAYRF